MNRPRKKRSINIKLSAYIISKEDKEFFLFIQAYIRLWPAQKKSINESLQLASKELSTYGKKNMRRNRCQLQIQKMEIFSLFAAIILYAFISLYYWEDTLNERQRNPSTQIKPKPAALSGCVFILARLAQTAPSCGLRRRWGPLAVACQQGCRYHVSPHPRLSIWVHAHSHRTAGGCSSGA